MTKTEINRKGTHQPTRFTIGLVLDCPTITVDAEKRFKALIDSWTTISLMHRNVYSMIGDCYKTSILPAVVYLKTVDVLPMPLMGKATFILELLILNLHTPSSSAIGYQKPIFLLASISRKGIPYLTVGMWTDSCSYRKEVHS